MPRARALLACAALALAAACPTPTPHDGVIPTRVVVTDSVAYKFVAAATKTDTVVHTDTVIKIVHDTVCVTGTPPTPTNCGTPPIPPDTTTPPPNPTGTPDPTQLPVALPNMNNKLAAYQAIGLPTKAAGFVYRDPTSNARITKLTSATFPAAGAGWGNPYFEGGTQVSYPYKADGVTRAFRSWGASSAQRISDVTPGSGVSNPRNFPAGGAPSCDLCFAFSTNPATPYYAYVTTGSQLVRIDVRTMTLAPGNGFPVTNAGAGQWLQNSENDTDFAWMAGSSLHYFVRATGRHATMVVANMNEPRLSRSGRYVGISLQNNGATIIDGSTTPMSIVYTQGGNIPFAHQASLKNFWVTNNWNTNYPFPFASVGITQGSTRTEWGPSVGSGPIGNGAWNQAGDQRNAWSLWNSQNSGLSGHDGWPQTWTAPGGIVLVTMNGGASNARLLTFSYATERNQNYWASSWPQFSSDGKVVIYSSDMTIVGGRYDQFLVELPLKP